MSYYTKQTFKKGAASFYIVAFATLILMIIAISFASIIISEITRTSNDDLAQSAYDSALAGVEDAKIAFANYRNCVASGATAKEPNAGDPLSCSSIIWYMEHPNCYMVGQILGREEGEVAIQETSIPGLNNQMQQFYTCVKIQTEPKDYRTTLSSTNQIKVVKVKFADGVATSRIKTVRLSWYSDSNADNFNYFNYKDGKVTFPTTGFTINEAKPPTISFAMIQTAQDFQLDSFDVTQGDRTNRAMVYLVPTNDTAATGAPDNYSAGYNGTSNFISKQALLKSNDKTTRNLPYTVYCPENSGQEFACSVEVELPEPIGGSRNDENFMFVVALPYGKPSTDVAMEFLCGAEDACSETIIENTDEEGSVIEESTSSNVATLKDVQIEIDSTGRANNLYRRVKTRLEGANAFDLSIMGPLELSNNKSGDNTALEKNLRVICEWNFPNRGC